MSDDAAIVKGYVIQYANTGSTFVLLDKTIFGIRHITTGDPTLFLRKDDETRDANYAELFDEIEYEIRLVSVKPKRLSKDLRRIIDADAPEELEQEEEPDEHV